MDVVVHETVGKQLKIILRFGAFQKAQKPEFHVGILKQKLPVVDPADNVVCCVGVM
jgi:hypothetical protein